MSVNCESVWIYLVAAANLHIRLCIYHRKQNMDVKSESNSVNDVQTGRAMVRLISPEITQR